MFKSLIFAIIFFSACTFLQAKTIVLKIRDFGAFANDQNNDAQAFEAAFKKMASFKGKASILFLEKGVYNLENPKNKKNLFQLQGLKNISLQGNESILMMNGFFGLFYFNQCNDIHISGITIDMSSLPYTCGKVISNGIDFFDLKVHEQQPAREGMVLQAVTFYDTIHQSVANQKIDYYQEKEPLRTSILQTSGLLRFYVKNSRGVPMRGNQLIVRHEIYGNDALYFNQCKNTSINNLQIYAAPGMGIVGNTSENFTIHHIKIIPKPGSGRWMSTTADAMHFENCRGAISIEHCEYKGMGDDAVNTHSYYMKVKEVNGNNKMVLENGRVPDLRLLTFKPGDTLAIGSESNSLIASQKIKVIESKMDSVSNTVVLTTEKYEFPIKKGQIVWNSSLLPSLTVKKCKITGNRARGILAQTSNVIIDSNRFIRCSGSAIHVSCDASYWWEGPGVRNVRITNNSIDSCNFGVGSTEATIDIYAELAGKNADEGVHQNILIENNILKNNNGYAIHCGSAIDVKIIKNTFYEQAQGAVLIDKSNYVTIKNNIWKKDLVLKRNLDLSKEIIISNNDGF